MLNSKIANKYLISLTTTIVFIFYAVINFIIYYLSKLSGNHGVNAFTLGTGDDGVFYWQEIGKLLIDSQHKTLIYPTVLAKIINLINIFDPIIVRIINLLGFLLLIIIAQKIVKLLRPEGNTISRFLVILLISLYPSVIYVVNLSILRDIWIYCFFLINCYFLVKFIQTKKVSIIDLILLIISMFFLYKLRSYAFLSLLLGLVIFSFFQFKISNRFRYLIVVSFAIGIIIIFKNSEFSFPIVNMSLNNALNYRNNFIEKIPGGSQMYLLFQLNNPAMLVANYILSILYNLMGPMPWQITNLRLLVFFLVESIPLMMFSIIIIYFKHSFSKSSSFLLINASVWLMLISFTNDNIGTATRLRPLTWILLFIVLVIQVPFKEKNHV